MNPFDLSGPEFLQLYLVVLAVALVAAGVARWLMRHPGDEPSEHALDLTPYEIAYLSGGESLAIDTAIIRLVHLDVLFLDFSARSLTRREKTLSANPDPLEKAIYDLAADEAGTLVERVRQSAWSTAAQLRERLDEFGLLIPEERLNAVRLVPGGIVFAASLFGWIKVFVGLARHRPVAYLVLLVLFSMGMAALFVFKRAFRSRRGDRALQQLKHENAALEYAASRGTRELADADRAGAVWHGRVGRRAARAAAVNLGAAAGAAFLGQRIVQLVFVKLLYRFVVRRRRGLRRRLRRRRLWRLWRRMNEHDPNLGLGVGWRPELALPIDRRRDLGFVEVMAEDVDARGPLPEPIVVLRERGLAVVPHGVSLSLGSAEPPDAGRLATLARLAKRLEAPLVSEHLAFVRGGGIETGHLLPLPRTRAALDLVVANVRVAQAALPVPLALENVATLFDWPDAHMDEATFLTEVLERGDVQLLLDLENVYANCRNLGGDASAFLDRLPLERIAYVHVGGGVERDGLYHDTHAHPVPVAVLDLLEELCARVVVPGVLLERDDKFPSGAELNAELDAIAVAVARGNVRRREGAHVA